MRACLLLTTFVFAVGCKPGPGTSTPEPEPSGPKTVAADIEIDMHGEERKARVPADLDVLLDEVRERASIPGIAAAVIDAGSKPPNIRTSSGNTSRPMVVRCSRA